MLKTIRLIICFLIAASVIIQMVPEKSYKKCMRYFIGIVFLVFVLSNVFKGISVFEDLGLDIFNENFTFSKLEVEYYENIFSEYYGDINEYEGSGQEADN